MPRFQIHARFDRARSLGHAEIDIELALRQRHNPRCVGDRGRHVRTRQVLHRARLLGKLRPEDDCALGRSCEDERRRSEGPAFICRCIPGEPVDGSVGRLVSEVQYDRHWLGLTRQVIYDPNTTTATGARTPFATNIIPADQLNPVGLKLASYYPLPNAATSYYGANNFNYTGGYPNRGDQYTFKGDQQFGNRLARRHPTSIRRRERRDSRQYLAMWHRPAKACSFAGLTPRRPMPRRR